MRVVAALHNRLRSGERGLSIPSPFGLFVHGGLFLLASLVASRLRMQGTAPASLLIGRSEGA